LPSKRRRRTPSVIRISPAAIEAWRSGDMQSLHRALGLRPWMISPLPLGVTALGCDPRHPPEGGPLWCASWQRAVELQAALLEIAGEPGEAVR